MDKLFYVEKGDLRMNYCLSFLEKSDYAITDNISDADYIILPFNAKPENYIGKINSNQAVFCFKTDGFCEICNAKSYCTQEYTEKNSLMTAQGTLAVLLENINELLNEKRIAVLGYGHCGKAICNLLKRYTSNISCYARSEIRQKEILRDGIACRYTVDKSVAKEDIIINTIPYNVLNEEILNSLNENSLYIEVASAPYGFDVSGADNYKFKFVSASGLPGKYTPISAGGNIAQAVIGIIKEDGYE